MASTTRCLLATLYLFVFLGNLTDGGPTFTMPAQQSQDHPGMCYNSHLKAVAVGDSVTDDRDCTLMKCAHDKDDPSKLVFKGEMCGTIPRRFLPGLCQVVPGNRSAAFPCCCRRVTCDFVSSLQ